MADEPEVTPAGTKKRRFIALADDNNQQDESKAPVVVGNRISEAAIRRSGLLDGIESTDGLASLPSTISPADVKLWESAYLLQVTPPLPELIAVLKVCTPPGCSCSNGSCWT